MNLLNQAKFIKQEGEFYMRNIKEVSYKELINEIGGEVVIIDLTAPSSRINPLELPSTEDTENKKPWHTNC